MTKLSQNLTVEIDYATVRLLNEEFKILNEAKFDSPMNAHKAYKLLLDVIESKA